MLTAEKMPGTLVNEELLCMTFAFAPSFLCHVLLVSSLQVRPLTV